MKPPSSTCPKCNGIGNITGKTKPRIKCFVCDGQGQVWILPKYIDNEIPKILPLSPENKMVSNVENKGHKS